MQLQSCIYTIDGATMHMWRVSHLLSLFPILLLYLYSAKSADCSATVSYVWRMSSPLFADVDEGKIVVTVLKWREECALSSMCSTTVCTKHSQRSVGSTNATTSLSA